MTTSSLIVAMLIVVGASVFGGSVYWAMGIIARLRRS